MNIKNHFFKTLILFAALLSATAILAPAQTPKSSPPRQEKLLNNLKLLMWTEPAAGKVTVKLRIHSGAAFDTLGKEGTMAMLADILFPNESVREFFREDLGGSLAVESNYDSIQINAAGSAEQILTILETISAAVTKPQIDKETTSKARTARLERVKELEKNPAYVADLAAAKRLFGNYPYGRSAEGTAESLQKIDFADLLLAKQKFLTADNATLAVSGNIKPDYVYKAVRQLFGGWEKSDKRVPATFAQPEAPDTKEFFIEIPNSEYGFRRSAIMVAGRSDKDFYATKILTEIWRNQFCLNDETINGQSSFEPYLLRGVYVIGTKFPSNKISELPVYSRGNYCKSMFDKDGKVVYPPMTQNDFETAKSRVTGDLNQKTLSVVNAIDLWLDVDTYKLVSVKDEIQRANSVTLADVQRVSENLQKQSFVVVSINNPVAQNKSQN